MITNFRNYQPPAISAERLNTIEQHAMNSVQPIYVALLGLSKQTAWVYENGYYKAEFKINLPETFNKTEKIKLEISISSNILAKETYKTLANADIINGNFDINSQILTLYSYGIPPLNLIGTVNLTVNIYYIGLEFDNCVLVHLPSAAYFNYNSASDGVNTVHYSASVSASKMGKADYWNWGRIGETVSKNTIDSSFHNFDANAENTEKTPEPLELSIDILEPDNSILDSIYFTNNWNKYQSYAPGNEKLMYCTTYKKETENLIYYSKIAATKSGIELYVTTSGNSSSLTTYGAFVITPKGEMQKIVFNNNEYLCHQIHLIAVQTKNNIDTISIIAIARNTESNFKLGTEPYEVYDIYWDASQEKVVTNQNVKYTQLFETYFKDNYSHSFYAFDKYYFGIDGLTKQEYCFIRSAYANSKYYYQNYSYEYDEKQQIWNLLETSDKSNYHTDLEYFIIDDGVFYTDKNNYICYIYNNAVQKLNISKFGTHNADTSYYKFSLETGNKHISPSGISIFYFEGYWLYIKSQFQKIYYIYQPLSDWRQITSWNIIGEENNTIVLQIKDNEALCISLGINGTSLNKEINITRENNLNTLFDGKYNNKLNFVNNTKYQIVNSSYSINNFVPVCDIQQDSTITITAHELSEQNIILQQQYNLEDVSWIKNRSDIENGLLALKQYNSFPSTDIISQNKTYLNDIKQTSDILGMWYYQYNNIILSSLALSNIGVNFDEDDEGYEYYKPNVKMSIYTLNYKKDNSDSSQITLGTQQMINDKNNNEPPFCWVKYRNISLEQYQTEQKGDK